jgi:hypothetical protein
MLVKNRFALKLLTMFEIFKTNIQDEETAIKVLDKIREVFRGRAVNIDLEDCDRILRIYSPGEFDPGRLVLLLDKLGIKANLLD